MTTLLRTPLCDVHKALGAKMVPFAGWEMPVQYAGGILAEHRAVREDAGIFDVCHMGEFEVTGPDRNAFVNRVTTNDVAALAPGQVQYSAFLNEAGGIVDDCTVYRFEDKVMLVVNAANIDKDWEHVVAQKKGANVRIRNVSDAVGLLALQGPRAEALLQPHTETILPDIGYYRFATGRVAGAGCFISRTGYTGEDGFELYCRAQDAVTIWQALTGPGKATPIGLGARDTLRLEVGYALYGNDIDDETTPLEAGLGWITKIDKGAPFMGEAALKRQKLAGVARRLVGFRMVGKGIPRHGMPTLVDGVACDVVRSGTMSPTLGYAIGTTYLPASHAAVGSRFHVDIRGEALEAEVVKRPFYTKGSVRR
ncbi:MAG: glycine cleavage system aminomethyltransferase GcvT [Gemmatimonadetes bacterium]|nr:glycine cleavage system aminomethyltransferase GcvT [Gemmatimonadota bacterium]MBK7786183.1 glycine cleavage system aminomethyltransferase GcvT [Gemmatimonadota bacterium]MBP9199430.1 glycine cleavage system aminomethyltransferase GcvT [Gemmatimonadales bacterium]